MKLFYPLFFLLLFGLLGMGQKSLAQSKLLPARVVKTPGDTLDGFLKFYDWKTSPNRIEFQESLEGPVQIFPASAIKSFYLPSLGDWYYAKDIQIEYYLKRVAENTGKIARTVTGHFFLSEVMEGNLISLYKLVDDEQKNRFFIQRDSVFSELINYEYTSFKNGKLFTTQVNQYLNQLQLITNDCSSLYINKTLAFSEKALLEILNNYHLCKNETIIRKHKQEKPIYNAVIIPGLFKINDINNPVPTIGIGLKISLPKNFHNNYGLVQIDQYRYNISENGTNQKGNSYHVTVLGGTYFGISKVKPFIHGGFQWPTVIGFTVGAGISYAKKINFEIRSPSLSGIMATMHYTFGRLK